EPRPRPAFRLLLASSRAPPASGLGVRGVCKCSSSPSRSHSPPPPPQLALAQGQRAGSDRAVWLASPSTDLRLVSSRIESNELKIVS
uniref:Uncharacterized protein n=1 Tax=Oryza meridionalis TaxID=40149 RepID=A0A0E0C9B8_9ORYZ